MEAIKFVPQEKKQCPFCGEIIQARAVKCRYCAEFLNTDEAKAAEAALNDEAQDEQCPEDEDDILFAGRPSLWGITGDFIRAIFFIAFAIFLIKYPVEQLSIFQRQQEVSALDYEQPANSFIAYELSEEQTLLVARYRVIVGASLIGLIVLMLLVRMLKLKMIYYEITADRVEWSRGILDRRVDNLDMFRILDLKLRRSLLDCMLGIGTVNLITNDKTEPEFNFEKIRDARELYDIIKKLSLAADKKQGVVHLE